MTFCDCHFHLVQCGAAPDINKMKGCTSYFACTCSHSPEEFASQEKMIAESKSGIHFVSSYGIHPQNPDSSFISFLESLLKDKKIGAIGEAGFDLFTAEYKSQIKAQEYVWNEQMELAAEYGVPLVVHCRKGLDRLFRDSKKLKRIPAVLFHSFMGGPADALSFLRKNINGFFCFGKPLLNGKKSAAECVMTLPPEVLVLETDAPFQTLKGETKTLPEEITRVYEEATAIRAADKKELSLQLEKNFKNAFGI